MRQHAGLVRKAGEDVDVVGHDDEAEQAITISVEVTKGVFDHGRALALTECALPVAIVEMVMPAIRELIVILGEEMGREIAEASLPIGSIDGDVVGTQPSVALGDPLFDHVPREGVCGAPGDENDGAGLRPVGELPTPEDGEIVVGIEEAHWVVRHHAERDAR